MDHIDHIDHIDHVDHIDPVSAIMRCYAGSIYVEFKSIPGNMS